MKKKQIAALAAGIGAGVWCAHRDKKYPVRKELCFANKLTAPGWAVNLGTAKQANRVLDRMALPAPPQGVERRGAQCFSADGAPVRLTIYRPKGLDRAAPCLVYFHGGGFCVRDAGYIHRYAAQYAQGGQCTVVFVHYRTADTAPFPAPFEDCYAALNWVWDNAEGLGVDEEKSESMECAWHDKGNFGVPGEHLQGHNDRICDGRPGDKNRAGESILH